MLQGLLSHHSPCLTSSSSLPLAADAAVVTWPELRRLVDSLVDEWVAKLEKAGQLSAARPVVAMEAGRLKTACE